MRLITATIVGILLLIGLAGCDMNSRQCSKTTIGLSITMDCEGRYDTLSSEQTARFEIEDIVGMTVDARITITVERGRVRASFESWDGQTIAGEAAPGVPLTLTGEARLQFIDEMRLTLQPLDGEVTGLRYQAHFEK
ncbi:MAG: hypothetical protein IPK19_39655 [Chloroflexi bacterium]|nr:hypothetical protein [Chloroflexota bacterium]